MISDEDLSSQLGLLDLEAFGPQRPIVMEAQDLGPTRLFAQLTLQERIFLLEDTSTRFSIF